MTRQDLQINVSEHHDTRIVKLTGELDSYTSNHLSKSADTWTEGVKSLIINMDGLQYIDSSGLSVIVGIWVKSARQGVKVGISCQNARIKKVLDITGLLNLFKLDTTAPEAKDFANNKPGASVPMIPEALSEKIRDSQYHAGA